MATWQQGINSGGFLAGIGGQNSNAPKASDVSEALAYIRQNNEMERSGRNNIGLQALQGLGSVAQTSQAAKQQEADAAFQKEYAAAIQSGDRQQVRDLMTKYPGQLEKIQSGMKWADEDQRNSIGTLAAGARLAASSPEAMQSWLQNNAKELGASVLTLTTLLRCISRILQGLVSLFITLGWLLSVRLTTSMFRTRWLVVRLTEAGWQRQSAAIRPEILSLSQSRHI